MVSIGLLLIRLVIGLSFMHMELRNYLDGLAATGLKGTGGWFESIGMKPGVRMALMAGLSELIGGALFAAGLLTPLGALLIAGTMVMAIVKVHGPNGYWATQNGYEYNLTLLVVAIGIAIAGPGYYALDTFIF